VKQILACLVLLVVATVPGAASADTIPHKAPADHHAAQASDDAEQQRKVGTATAGVLILVGVAAIGLLLIAAAIIWGGKVRRLVRYEAPEPTRQDDLWYLRKERPADDTPSTEPSAEESPADGS